MLITQPVPTNVITGFLGVGKSTAIMHLLKFKPANERWAILVNEFGEVGIDGSLLSGNKDNQTDIHIREVTGGCMCCTAGLPMQIALNLLLAKANPHRLLIEPTGLGHPKEVLSTLNNEYYAKVLDIQRTITLVDARKLQDTRYTSHDIFKQQLEVADVIVANKADLYKKQHYQHLKDYLQQNHPNQSVETHQVTKGELSLQWLQGKPHFLPCSTLYNPQPADNNVATSAIDFPKEGFVCFKNKGKDFFSQGWIFQPHLTFNSDKLYDLLVAESFERLKAVFITNEGIIAFNKSDDILTQQMLDETFDSRIEIITRNHNLLSTFEDKLVNCLISN